MGRRKQFPKIKVSVSGHYRLIRLPSSQMGNYIGMNFYAARELGFPFPYSPNVIALVEGLEGKKASDTLRHEKIEIALMKKGYKYKEAHQVAKTLERG